MIKVGNTLYRKTLSSGFLHIGEGLDLVPSTFNLKLIDEHNSFVRGNTDESLSTFFQNLENYNQKYFAVVILKEKAMSMFKENNKVLVVDTHSHGRYGGKISVFDLVDSQVISDMFGENNDIAYACTILS